MTRFRVREVIVAVTVLPVVAMTLGCGRHEHSAHDNERWTVHRSQAAAAVDRDRGRSRNPSVVMVVMDTVRADRTGRASGSCAVTPVFDRLAQDAVVFENAVSTSSWTLPAHASLFSGLYLYQHGVHWMESRNPGLQEAGGYCAPLPERIDTLAEVLSRNGYTTLGVSANYWLTPSMGFAQGFDEYHVASKDETAAGRPRGKPYVLGDEVVDRAIDLLDAAGANPFFLFVNLLDPHAPYYPEDAFQCASRQPSASEAVNDPLADGNIYGSGLRRAVNLGEQLPPQPVRTRLEALYDDEVSYADHLVGRLVDRLDQGAIDDTTLLVVLSDHGESFFTHGMVNHGLGVYEETVRVPLLMRLPGTLPARAVTDRVELIDVMPTILSITGLSREPVVQRDGWFAVDLLDDEMRTEGRAALAENYRNPWEAGLARSTLLRTSRATTLDGWKLIRGVDDQPVELYDLTVDPDEQTDLGSMPGYVEQREVLTRLELQLSSGAVFYQEAEGTRGEVDVEALRALGYLDGESD